MAKKQDEDVIAIIAASDGDEEGQNRPCSKDSLSIRLEATNEPVVTRKELWSYYLYYNGDNGVGPGSYSTALWVSDFLFL